MAFYYFDLLNVCDFNSAEISLLQQKGQGKGAVAWASCTVSILSGLAGRVLCVEQPTNLIKADCCKSSPPGEAATYSLEQSNICYVSLVGDVGEHFRVDCCKS
jgi:hypothetical protein